MTDKTPIGIDLLDSSYGGIFRGRPFLISGPSKSGKTAAAFHFLRKGLRLRERCLILTARPAADVLAEAEGLGLGFADAAREGELILLEYGDDVPGRHNETQITLPPDSFMQLATVISEQAVMRLVLDTCVPWVAVNSPDRLEEHVFSFIRSLDRMGVTTMLTMPKAASLASAKLYKMIEAQVPVSLTLDVAKNDSHRMFIVNKYLGMDDKIGLELPFVISKGLGITHPDKANQEALKVKESPTVTDDAQTSGGPVAATDAAAESDLPTVDRRSRGDRRLNDDRHSSEESSEAAQDPGDIPMPAAAKKAKSDPLHYAPKTAISFAPSMPSISMDHTAPSDDTVSMPKYGGEPYQNPEEKPHEPKDSGLRFSAPVEKITSSGEW